MTPFDSLLTTFVGVREREKKRERMGERENDNARISGIVVREIERLIEKKQINK